MEGILVLKQENEKTITSYSFVTTDGVNECAVMRVSKARDTIELCDYNGVRYASFKNVKTLVPYVEVGDKRYRVVRNLEMGRDILLCDINTTVKGRTETHFTTIFPGDDVIIMDQYFAKKMNVEGIQFRVINFNPKQKKFMIIAENKSFEMYRDQLFVIGKPNTVEEFILTELEDL